MAHICALFRHVFARCSGTLEKLSASEWRTNRWVISRTDPLRRGEGNSGPRGRPATAARLDKCHSARGRALIRFAFVDIYRRSRVFQECALMMRQ